ncbi:MAG TPA: NADH-quinone oxidoreductase subunit L [Cyclobacteriaceae bacterium]|nr:NADH-quinone oxidoreductase subunit L [Cyclobacteriaceae bacterium]
MVAAAIIPLLPLLGFLLVSLNVNRLSKTVAATIACGVMLVAFLAAAVTFFTMGESIEISLFTWIKAGTFTSSFGFLIDPLSIIFVLVITGVGFLIHVYSIGYMHDDEGQNRFFSYLNLFVFFMLLLVMGKNYLIVFVGWEGVGLCSYLLIGFWFKNQEYNSAANKAFIMNRIGDLGMLVGIILIFIYFGSIEYSDVLNSSSAAPITLITFLLFIGAMGKSAQIPLYTWLPDAMAGPTPVSALIHAATMVTAGIYMVARNHTLYLASPLTMEIVMIVGLATAILAATIAVAQNDIKKVLAYSTVSQLGLIFVALGLGAFTAGIFHVVTHAFFKALLFLGAGSIIHALGGEQDLRKMGGLRKYLPITFITFLFGVLAISGIPPFAGFFSKDEILAAAFAHSKVIWALAVFASLLTSFYMFRLFFLAFFGNERAGEHAMSHIHESPKSITIPLTVLAILSVTGGFLNVPGALGGNHMMERFLEPVFSRGWLTEGATHANANEEILLMIIIVALTLAVITFAWLTYVKKSTVPDEPDQTTGLTRLLAHKYYVDELYNFIVVKPLYLISKLFYNVVELLGIDGIVNGLGKGVVYGSRGLRFFQDGSIGYYLFVMVISIIVILSVTLW